MQGYFAVWGFFGKEEGRGCAIFTPANNFALNKICPDTFLCLFKNIKKKLAYFKIHSLQAKGVEIKQQWIYSCVDPS